MEGQTRRQGQRGKPGASPSRLLNVENREAGCGGGAQDAREMAGREGLSPVGHALWGPDENAGEQHLARSGTQQGSCGADTCKCPLGRVGVLQAQRCTTGTVKVLPGSLSWLPRPPSGRPPLPTFCAWRWGPPWETDLCARALTPHTSKHGWIWRQCGCGQLR